MTRLLWLPGVLRAAGLTVVEVPGWQTRGADGIAPRVVLDHHTASSRKGGNAPSLNVIVNGRPDLPGPLSNVLIGRDGTCYVTAAGVSNNAGRGGSPMHGAVHNRHTIGVEIENDGIGEPWTDRLLDVCRRHDAAICRHLGWTADRCVAHREWATPKGRKVDPSWDQNAHRAAVARLLAPTPPPSEEDDDPMLDRLIKAYLDAGRTPAQIPFDEIWTWRCEVVRTGDLEGVARFITWSLTAR